MHLYRCIRHFVPEPPPGVLVLTLPEGERHADTACAAEAAAVAEEVAGFAKAENQFPLFWIMRREP